MPLHKSPVHVHFIIPYSTEFGEELRVVGSSDKLGNWDAEKAPAMFWTEGGQWSLELSFAREDVPFEYKYVVVKTVKKKKMVPSSPTGEEGVVEETEVEFDEVTSKWENTPNRKVSGEKSKVVLKEKWEKPQQTESEIALEERNNLLEDLKSFETLIFPSFTVFPRPLGNKEFAVGIIGEPDRSTTKGQPKDRHRNTFMEGVLRKTEDNHYQLFWLGRQNFVSKYAGERKYDVSDLLPFDLKIIAVDDSAAEQVKEVLKTNISASVSNDDLKQTLQSSVDSLDWEATFNAVVDKLGGSGANTNEGILWEPVSKKWMYVPRISGSSVPRKGQRKSSEINAPDSYQEPSISVRVYSDDKFRGTSAFQRVPGETDIICIKTVEYNDDAFTYITVLDSRGRSILPDTYVGPFKYEGFLIIKDLDSPRDHPYIASSDCDISALRKREQEVRESIKGAQVKCTTLQGQEVSEKKIF